MRSKQELPLRGRCSREHRPCKDWIGHSGTPVPEWEPREFVVDLLEETGTMDRREAGVLLSIFEWVEVEASGFPELMEALFGPSGSSGLPSLVEWMEVEAQGFNPNRTAQHSHSTLTPYDWIVTLNRTRNMGRVESCTKVLNQKISDNEDIGSRDGQ